MPKSGKKSLKLSQKVMPKTGKTSGLEVMRMAEIKPSHYITEEKCKEMIDDAIRKHNRNASIISVIVGWIVLALFAEGLLRLIGVIEPVFPWLDIHTLL